MTGTSPPGPLRCGSTTCSVKAVATAASKALPPRSRMPMPTAVAIQWVEATTPKVPTISGRVVNGLGFISFMSRPPRRMSMPGKMPGDLITDAPQELGCGRCRQAHPGRHFGYDPRAFCGERAVPRIQAQHCQCAVARAGADLADLLAIALDRRAGGGP